METTTTEELIRTHDRLSADPSFQQFLPEPPPPVEQADLSFLRELFEAIGRFFQFLVPLLKLLLVAAVAALLIFIVYSIVRAVYDRRESLKRLLNREKSDADLSTVDLRPEEHTARALLSDADRLAAAGRYGEAIRMLLHSSINDMQERIHRRIGVSLTAREIGGLGSMPDVSRHAFHRIIHTVEINVFGEQMVGEADYQKAREDYAVFAFEGKRP